MPATSEIEIVTYKPELREAFKTLNLEWLEGYSLLEPVDLEYLEHPEEKILATGGQLFFALQSGVAVGACAVICLPDKVFELAKLAVSPAAQRGGIGRRLSRTAIEFAQREGATSVVLTSNSALVQAIRLYESLGFQHEPVPKDVRYQKANVYMTLKLTSGG